MYIGGVVNIGGLVLVWFRNGKSCPVFVSALGGRQGCTLGGILFKGSDRRALYLVEESLDPENLTLQLHKVDHASLGSIPTSD